MVVMAVKRLVVLFAFLLLFGCPGSGLQGPSGVNATPASGGIHVAWNPVSGVAGYNVYRSAAPGTEGGKINPSLIVGETAYTDTGVSDGVTYYYTIKSVDSGGAEYASAQASATARTLPPRELQVTINGGANFTTSTGVSLALSATGAKECRLSNDASSWGDWASYTNQASWQLQAGDGQKTVYYTCRDDVGNTAQPVSASIYLATSGPTINVRSPVQGNQYAGSFDLIFTLMDPTTSRLTCSANLDGQLLEMGAFDTGIEYNFTIEAPPGTHTISGECNNGMVNSSKSITFTVIDKPGIRLVIGDGSGYTMQRSVTLQVDANLAHECRFSNDGYSWGNWGAYSRTVQWQLTANDGTKNVYAQCRSAAGTLSDTVHETVELDTSPPPFITIAINNKASTVNSRNVTLGLHAYAADQCKFSNDNQYSWSSWEPYSTRRQWTLSPGDGTKTVFYNCRKADGGDVGTASATVQLHEIPPIPPTGLNIEINGGATYTNTRSVDLQLHAQYASQCRFGNSNYDWGSWYDYTTYTTYTLPSGEGQKTVYYQCKNDYGTATTYSTIYYEEGPPTSISIKINNGAQYTTTTSVHLTLYASRASQCQYQEQGYGWSGWETYTTYRAFTISSDEGQKVIYYQCRNSGGTSSPASASIYLDMTPPPPIYDLSASPSGNYVVLSWSPPERGGTPIKEYRIMRSTAGFGLITQVGTVRTPGYTDTHVSAGNSYNYWVRSVDVNNQVSEDSNMASASVGLVGPLEGE